MNVNNGSASYDATYFDTSGVDDITKEISFLDYTNLFCTNEYEKNDEIILKYFQ